jgi:hypothetical protein
VFKLIEPIYKDKIGAGQSYPLGTEAISKALEGIPQYSKLSLTYRNGDGASLGATSSQYSMGKVKQDTSDLINFQQVLTAAYSHRWATWSLILQRVSSAQNKQVKSFLLQTGLPLLKDWLSQERPDTWYNGYWYFQIGVNKAMDQYAVRENFNHQLISKYKGPIG